MIRSKKTALIYTACAPLLFLPSCSTDKKEEDRQKGPKIDLTPSIPESFLIDVQEIDGALMPLKIQTYAADTCIPLVVKIKKEDPSLKEASNYKISVGNSRHSGEHKLVEVQVFADANCSQTIADFDIEVAGETVEKTLGIKSPNLGRGSLEFRYDGNGWAAATWHRLAFAPKGSK